jgi:hypothetical protein
MDLIITPLISIGIIAFVIYLAVLSERTKKLRVKNKRLKKVKETKCTCKACGNVWFYTGQEAFSIKMDKFGKFGKDMMRVVQGGMAWLFPEDKISTITAKCPKCNSTAISKEPIVHEV